MNRRKIIPFLSKWGEPMAHLNHSSSTTSSELRQPEVLYQYLSFMVTRSKAISLIEGAAGQKCGHMDYQCPRVKASRVKTTFSIEGAEGEMWSPECCIMRITGCSKTLHRTLKASRGITKMINDF